MVYFPAVDSHPTPPRLVFFFLLFFHPGEGCQAAEKDFTHTHTPHYASEGFPDVLVYIMECAGRGVADSESSWLCLSKSYADLHSFDINAGVHGNHLVRRPHIFGQTFLFVKILYYLIDLSKS